MGVKERRERQRDERSEQIIRAARAIVSEEGLENLSIRKIAKRIEYSPAIIYHYFTDKNDIVHHLMKEGYQKIVTAISPPLQSEGRPEERLKQMTRRYIDAALEIPDEFMAIQLNQSPEILHFTSSLFKGASQSKPALKALTDCLKDLYAQEELDPQTLELTAQTIAVSTFGLIIKLMIEKDISAEQKERLIAHYIKCIVDAMLMGKRIPAL